MLDGREDNRQQGAQPGATLQRAHKRVAICVAAVALGMVGLSYAAVPLYQIFCQVTGFGGTTQRAEEVPAKVLDKTITVRFDANVARTMPWRFTPVSKPMTLKIGESALAFYEAENPTAETIRGTATFNVTPEAAGVYFNKVQCFCFTEQVLKPGQRIDMPVTFFIDPEIINDPDAKNIREITLSYTFFRSDKAAGIAAVADRKAKDGS
ncbi:MAG: cytochrome c oxidase assembly protein [Alphaproteobacteria bacterium]|nr:MAG: cytochrome c oxidase assembly protein [Alphaproteobacteria bacterium]